MSSVSVLTNRPVLMATTLSSGQRPSTTGGWAAATDSVTATSAKNVLMN